MSSKSIDGSSQRVPNSSRRRFLGIRRWSMNCTTLNEQTHQDNESNSHKQNCPPVFLQRKYKYLYSQFTNVFQKLESMLYIYKNMRSLP